MDLRFSRFDTLFGLSVVEWLYGFLAIVVEKKFCYYGTIEILCCVSKVFSKSHKSIQIFFKSNEISL